MEAWVRVSLEKAKDQMILSLEENIEGLEPSSEGLTYGLSAVKLCKKAWIKVFKDLPQKCVPDIQKVDPNYAPEDQFQIMRNMNVSMRAQLKEQNKIARKVYTTLIGTGTNAETIQAGCAGSTSATAGPNRTLDLIHQQLLSETEKMREELFLLQHAAQGTEFDKKEFSLNDYFHLAEFKLNHAATQTLWANGGAGVGGGEGSLELDMRLQSIQSEHQAKVQRLERQVEAERQIVRNLAKSARAEIEEVHHTHQGVIRKMQAEHGDEMDGLLEAHDEEVKQLIADQELKLSDMQHNFATKLLAKDAQMGQEEAEGATKTLEDLRKVFDGSGNRPDGAPNFTAAFGGDDFEVGTGAIDILYDRGREQDVHARWEGETEETLRAQLQGRRAELEMLLGSHHVALKARTLEWESALRDIIAKYEKELQAANRQAIMDTSKIETLGNAMETKQREMDNLKQLLLSEREAYDERHQDSSREADARLEKQKNATSEIKLDLLAARKELKAVVENQALEIDQYLLKEQDLLENVKELKAKVESMLKETEEKGNQTEAVSFSRPKSRTRGRDHFSGSPTDASGSLNDSRYEPWDDLGDLKGSSVLGGSAKSAVGSEHDGDGISESGSTSKRSKKGGQKKGKGVPKSPRLGGVSPAGKSLQSMKGKFALEDRGDRPPGVVSMTGSGRKKDSPGGSPMTVSINNRIVAVADDAFLTQQGDSSPLDRGPTTMFDGGKRGSVGEGSVGSFTKEGEDTEGAASQRDLNKDMTGGNARGTMGNYDGVKSKLNITSGNTGRYKAHPNAIKTATTTGATPGEAASPTEFITSGQKPSFTQRPISNIRNKFAKPKQMKFGEDDQTTSSKKDGRDSRGGSAGASKKLHLSDLDLSGAEQEQHGTQESTEDLQIKGDAAGSCAAGGGGHSGSSTRSASPAGGPLSPSEFGPPEDFTDVLCAMMQSANDEIQPSAMDLLPKTISEPRFYELLGQMALLAEYATSGPKEHTLLQLVKRLRPLMPPRLWERLNSQQVVPIHPLDVTGVLHYFQEYIIPQASAIHRNRPFEVRLFKQVSELVRSLSSVARVNEIPRSFQEVNWADLEQWTRQEGQGGMMGSVPRQRSPPRSPPQRGGGSPLRDVSVAPMVVKQLTVDSIELLSLCRELNAHIASNVPTTADHTPKPPAMMIVSQVQLPSVSGVQQLPPTSTGSHSLVRTPVSHQHLVATATTRRDSRVTHVQTHRQHQKRWSESLPPQSGAPAPIPGWNTPRRGGGGAGDPEDSPPAQSAVVIMKSAAKTPNRGQSRTAPQSRRK